MTTTELASSDDTLTFEEVSGYFVVAQGQRPATATQWAELCGALARARQQVRGLLVYSAGGAPDVHQRSELARIHQRSPFRVAVLSDSAVVRGAITALRWLDVEAKSFPPNDGDLALDWLFAPENERGDLQRALERQMAKVG